MKWLFCSTEQVHSYPRSHAISSKHSGLEGQETTVDLIRPHTQKHQEGDMNVSLTQHSSQGNLITVGVSCT